MKNKCQSKTIAPRVLHLTTVVVVITAMILVAISIFVFVLQREYGIDFIFQRRCPCLGLDFTLDTHLYVNGSQRKKELDENKQTTSPTLFSAQTETTYIIHNIIVRIS